MILALFIIVPAAGGLLAWLLGRLNSTWPKWVALSAMVIDLILGVLFAFERVDSTGPWLAEIQLPWIPQLGIGFFLAADSLSLVLVLLTALMGIMAVASAWTEINERTGFFYFNLLWVLAGITGVFLALDLFLFYFFWEMMLVPMYFIIAIWGHENRVYAASKFFLFTQASGLLMLLAILGLYFVHGRSTGIYTFNYMQLLGTSLSPATAMWLMLGFFVAFAVKLPAVPFHSWLPDAHTEAPTAGSVILAGLLLKTGAYGLLRFVVPLFPAAAAEFSPVAMTLAAVSILYGALQALGQTDLKRLIAYTSVSHMGFVLLGIFAWNRLALQGAVMQIICHGISTGALFILVGALQERIHTRDLNRMGGLWSIMPRMGAAMMLFSLASLGLPGLGNFIGEFLVLLGAFRASAPLTVVASLGFITSCVYSLWIVQRTFHGPNREEWKVPDLSIRESAVMAVMTILIVWLGLFPQPVFTFVNPSLARLERIAAGSGRAMQIDGPVTAALPAKAFEAAVSQRGERP
jgi:NADH-quinone oxidoreductase subunit M